MQYLDNMVIDKKRIYKAPVRLNEYDGGVNGLLLVPFAFNTEKLIEFLEKELFRARRINSYHIDKRYQFHINGSSAFRENINPLDHFNKVKQDLGYITNYKPMVTSYNGSNLVEDIHQYIQLFYKSIKSQNIRILIPEFFNFLNNFFDNDRFNKYEKKYLFVNLDDMKDFKKYLFFNGEDENEIDYPSFLSLLMRGLYLKIIGEENGQIPINFNIIIYKNHNFIDLEKSYKYDFKKLDTMIDRLYNMTDEDNVVDPKITLVDKKNDKITHVFKSIDNLVQSKTKISLGLTGTTKSGKTDSMEIIRLRDKVIEVEEENTDENMDDLFDRLKQDPEFLDILDTTIKSNKIPITDRNKKRNDLLMDRKNKLIVKDGSNRTLNDILEDSMEALEVIDISDKIKGSPKSYTKFVNIQREYVNKTFNKDIVSVFNSLGDDNKSIKCIVTDIKVDDTSTDLDYKYTWTVKYEDELRTRHTIKVDIPKIVDDFKIYFSGSLKNILNQKIYLPIVKTNSNEVQITSNYNKIFIRRFGQKASPRIEMLLKFLSKTTARGFTKVSGINFNNNSQYITDLEYNAMSGKYTKIITPELVFYFNQDVFREEVSKLEVYKLLDHKLLDQAEYIPVAFNKKSNELYVQNMVTCDLFLINDKKVVTKQDNDIYEILLNEYFVHKPSLEKDFYTIPKGKQFMFSRCKIMGKDVPVVILLSFLLGLTPLMNRADIKYEVSETKKVLKGADRYRKEIITFKNGYLIYDRYPLENSLLLNGLNSIDTTKYNIEDMNKRETYMEIFQDLFDRMNIFQAFINFHELLMDPITIDICVKKNLPTNMVDLMLHGIKIVADNSKGRPEIRIRSIEMIAGILYDELSKAYGQYRIAKSNGRNKASMSLKQNCVISKLMTMQTVEEYSGINTIAEAEKRNAVSPKGHSGINIEEALTLDKRKYDFEDTGVFSIVSPPSGKVGTIRELAWNAKLKSTRGFIEDCVNTDELEESNLYGVAEALNVNSRKDDAMRNAMSYTQFKHLVPTKVMDYNRLCNGAERSLPYYVGDDFAFKAKDSGKVLKIDLESNIMIVKYDNGSKDAIDLSKQMVKNAGGGFYLPYKLTPALKVGKKFTKMDVLAYNDKFFKSSEYMGLIATSGRMTQIALAGGGFTYEDGSLATDAYCDELSSEVNIKTTCQLDAYTNVGSMVNVGDAITVGEPLIIFENNTSDPEFNKYLDKLGADGAEEILALGKNVVKSKYTGVVEAIKIYHTIDIVEMSPSLQKICRKYNKTINKRKKFVKENEVDVRDTNIHFDPSETIKDDKVKGFNLGDGILIEFHITYFDRLKIGDKVTKSSALKNIAGDIVPVGLEPFPESDPSTTIDTFLGDISLLSRMTPSIIELGAVNKLLIKLDKLAIKTYFD